MSRCKTCQFSPCRCEDLAAGYMGMGVSPAAWNLKSDSAAVHPDQIPEAMAFDKAHGVGTVRYDPKYGRPIFESRGQRKEYMRAHGYFDKCAGYGDASPGDSRREVDLDSQPVYFGDDL